MLCPWHIVYQLRVTYITCNVHYMKKTILTACLIPIHRNLSGVDVAISLASNPGLPPPGCSSRKLHDFVQEQRKIVSSIRCQPWPMQMKLAAIRWVGGLGGPQSQYDYARLVTPVRLVTLVRLVGGKHFLASVCVLETVCYRSTKQSWTKLYKAQRSSRQNMLL